MDQLIEIVSGFLIGLAVVTPIVLKLKGILREVGELMTELADALEDGKITKSEIGEIVKEAQDILGLFKK
jgi:mevalonate kinase